MYWAFKYEGSIIDMICSMLMNDEQCHIFNCNNTWYGMGGGGLID